MKRLLTRRGERGRMEMSSDKLMHHELPNCFVLT
jgi:hypothetical protein